MNVQLLIDSIVRQTTVLIAQLATAGGVRAPLSHVAGQVFVELSRALEELCPADDSGLRALWMRTGIDPIERDAELAAELERLTTPAGDRVIGR